MDITTISVVLFAACLHSGWNFFVKKDSNQFFSLSLTAIMAGVLCAIALPFSAEIHPDAWWYLAFSTPLHAGYRIFLAIGYKNGAFSQVYPISRGAIPVFVLAISTVFLGLEFSAGMAIPVFLVVLGILGLAFVDGLPSDFKAIGASLMTAAFVAVFTVIDAMGAAVSQNPLAYILWIFILEGASMLAVALAFGGGRAFLDYSRQYYRMNFLTGTIMAFSHGLIIWALARGSIPMVTAMREAGLIISLFLGVFFLKESFGPVKLVSTILVVLGIVLMA